MCLDFFIRTSMDLSRCKREREREGGREGGRERERERGREREEREGE